ncbi:Actin-like ATPase [Glarea lozoyensis ATCC 20868]|uniref:Actin-like ATPase n=1 Tax=Glarea lozoyensis (strain ATCC 20868 / MF5171) TaxID=1116229 RepID=S3CUX1_GLAL2|nr:Actin-like ATPase [Glarea lozoyensis ATCC 20868]EPE28769.1 Actin-like ATPase [Glarea lozoyensis ATCC 20868]
MSTPELVVAIDFGTDVAFCNISTGEETVRWLQKWPGRANAVENKVPTVLVYPKNSSTPSSWGFLSEVPAEQMSQDKECKEWFKTFLDDERLAIAQRDGHQLRVCPSSMQEVERLYCDFFQFLYKTIQEKLQGELANRWEDAKIEFIFSVPTTWKPVPTVERFKSVVERAGFGIHPNHKAIIGLTEAEAAANRDVLLVCDVGGGTTDLCVLRMLNQDGGGAINLEQLDVVQGATIGSVQLDTAFEKLARNRLRLAQLSGKMGLFPGQLDDVAGEMAESQEYQNAKCEYGSDHQTEYFTVAVPRLARAYINDLEGIRHGEMKFRRDDIKASFDVQVRRPQFQLAQKSLTISDQQAVRIDR